MKTHPWGKIVSRVLFRGQGCEECTNDMRLMPRDNRRKPAYCTSYADYAKLAQSLVLNRKLETKDKFPEKHYRVDVLQVFQWLCI